jgi:hypothetical protein
LETLTERVQAIRAVQVTDRPSAILKVHLGMDTANVLILDTKFALFRTPDSKQFRELTVLTHTAPNRYLQSW